MSDEIRTYSLEEITSTGPDVGGQTAEQPRGAFMATLLAAASTFVSHRLDGKGAPGRLLAFRTYPPGMCLQAVSKALGAYTLTSNRPGWYQWALRAWEATPVKRRKSGGEPPKGVPIYFSASGNGYGHVALSDGNGYCISTDIPYNGQVGRVKITDLARAWGRNYLGWASWFMGHEVIYNTPTSTTEPAASGLKWPFEWYTVKSGDTKSSIAAQFKISGARLGWLNPSIVFSSLKVGQVLKVAVDNLDRKIREDGIFGAETWAKWQRASGFKITGTGGRDFIRHIQRIMNRKRKTPVPVTGRLDYATARAIQEWINAPVKDGVLTPGGAAIRKLQKQLNEGTHSWA